MDRFTSNQEQKSVAHSTHVGRQGRDVRLNELGTMVVHRGSPEMNENMSPSGLTSRILTSTELKGLCLF